LRSGDIGRKIKHHVRDLLRSIKEPDERTKRVSDIDKYLKSGDRPAIIAEAMRSFIVSQGRGIGSTSTDELFHIVNDDLREFDLHVESNDNEKLNLRNYYLRATEVPKGEGRLFVYVVMAIEVLWSDIAWKIKDEVAFKEAIRRENIFHFVENWLATGISPLPMGKKNASTMDVYDNMRQLLRIAPFPKDLLRIFKEGQLEAHFVGYRCGSNAGELVKTFIVCHRPPEVLMKSPYFTVFYPFQGPGKEKRVRKSVGAIVIYDSLIYMIGVSAEVKPTDDKIDIDEKADFLGFKVVVLNESDVRIHTEVVSGLTLSHDRVTSALSSRIILLRTGITHHSGLKLGVIKDDEFLTEIAADGVDLSESSSLKILDYLRNRLPGETGNGQALTMQPLKL